MTPLQLLETLLHHVFGWMALGVVLTFIFKIPEKSISWTLKWLCIRSTISVMIYHRVLLHYDPSHPLDLLPYAGGAFVFFFISNFSSRLLSRIFTIKQDLPSFHLGNTIHNYGFLAYGLVEVLIGAHAMPRLFAFVLVFETLLWTWGVKTIDAKKTSPFKAILSPPAFAMFSAMIMVSCGFSWPLGTFLEKPMVIMSECSLPLVLTALGGLLYYTGKTIQWRDNLFSKDLWITISFRHAIFPLVMGSLIYFLMPMGEYRSILLIQSVMPMALMPLTLVSLYGGDVKPIGLAICMSMLVSPISTYFWVLLYL